MAQTLRRLHKNNDETIIRKRNSTGTSVAGMRRRYPGNKSYSLGNLCAVFDIELEDHHRALCDARAATQLPDLINQKRDSMGPLTEVAEALVA